MRRSFFSTAARNMNEDEFFLVKSQKIATKNNLAHYLDPFEVTTRHSFMERDSDYYERTKKVWFSVTAGDYSAILGEVNRVKDSKYSFEPAYSSSVRGTASLDHFEMEADLIARKVSRNKKNFDKSKYIIVRNAMIFYKDDSSKDKYKRIPSRFSYDAIRQLVELVDDNENFQTIFRALRYNVKNKEDIQALREYPEEWMSSLFSNN